MISAPATELRDRAEAWMRRFDGSARRRFAATVRPGESAVGGGSLPGETLATHVLAVRVADAQGVAAALRRASTPMVCRIQQDQLLFDPRTVLPEQEDAFLSVLADALTASHAARE